MLAVGFDAFKFVTIKQERATGTFSWETRRRACEEWSTRADGVIDGVERDKSLPFAEETRHLTGSQGRRVDGLTTFRLKNRNDATPPSKHTPPLSGT